MTQKRYQEAAERICNGWRAPAQLSCDLLPPRKGHIHGSIALAVDIPRGWRLVEYAIRTCNRSLTKKRTLSLQVRDPHDRDRVPIVVRLLFCLFVAGPHEVLRGRKGLSLLL